MLDLRGFIGATYLVVTYLCSTAAFSQEMAKVEYDLVVTNGAGDEMEAVAMGDSFLLNAYVTDLRTDSPIEGSHGIFSAYLDVEYPSALVSISGPIAYGANYDNAPNADVTTPGLINEAGGLAGLEPTGKGALLLWQIPMTATSVGAALFNGNPVEDLPGHQTTVYGEDVAIPVSQQVFRGTSLQVVPEPSSSPALLAIGLLSWLASRRSRR